LSKSCQIVLLKYHFHITKTPKTYRNKLF